VYFIAVLNLPITFPGFMSVAVFITDQSKYTENFERKNMIERKKIRDQASKKAQAQQ
jgi:hypothetical protein